MDIDLIIQGPVDGDNLFLKKMDILCEQFNKVIISTWSGENKDWQDQLKKYPNVEVTSVDLPPRPSEKNPRPGIVNNSTFYWACLSTYNGLIKSTAEYIIKMRSDEYYESFSLIKKELNKGRGRLVEKFAFGNIFYRQHFEGGPYHIGDHVYGCKREYILNGLKEALDYYDGKNTGEHIEFKQDVDQHYHCAEVVLAHMFLLGAGIPRNEWYEHTHYGFTIFNKHFKVIDINRLGDYQASWAAAGKIFDPRNNIFFAAAEL